MAESQESNLPSQKFMQRLCQIPEICKESSLSGVSSVGSYELLEEIGRGGMGTVYKAIDTRNGQTVAIKLMRSRDPQFQARFRLEAANLVRAAKGVASEYVVRPLEASSDGEVPYIAMEYVRGTSLSERIASSVKERNPIAIPEACDYIRQVAIGLGHLHDQSIIHRDIKPSNLICTETGRVRILDFGISKFVGSQEDTSENTGMTENHQILGTQEYMAPELFGGSSNLTERSDIYSLGATFYKLLTGFAPYRETEASRRETMAYAHAHRKITPVQQLRPDVPDRLATVIHKMLSIKPANRFRTAQEVAVALGHLNQTSTRFSTWRRRGRIYILAGILCLLAILFVTNKMESLVETSGPETQHSAHLQTLMPVDQMPVEEEPEYERTVAEAIIESGGSIRTVPADTPTDLYQSVGSSWKKEWPSDKLWIVDAWISQPERNGQELIAKAVRLPHLKWISFHANVNDHGFSHTKEAGSQLELVGFDGSKITGKTLSVISEWRSLRRISFSSMQQIRSRDLRALRNSTSLVALDIKNCSITDSEILEIGEFQNLAELYLDGISVTGSALARISNRQNLWALGLLNCPQINDRDLSFLDEMPNLAHLDLSGTNITNDALHHVARLKKLSVLKLDGQPITGDGLTALAACKLLKLLSINRCTGINKVDLAEFLSEHPNCDVKYSMEADPGFAALLGQSDQWVWSPPEPLPEVTQNSGYLGVPALSADGLVLAFSSDQTGGFGDKDIWISRRSSVHEPWPLAQNAGAIINTPAAEWSPTLSSDGAQIYFHSHRTGSISGDIWKAAWDSHSTSWQPAVRMSDDVNSSKTEQWPLLSPDGTELQVWSNGPRYRENSAGLIVVHRRQSVHDDFGIGRGLLDEHPRLRHITAEVPIPMFYSSDSHSIVFLVSRAPSEFVVCSRGNLDAEWESPTLVPCLPTDTNHVTYSPQARAMVLSREGDEHSKTLWQMRLHAAGESPVFKHDTCKLLFSASEKGDKVVSEVARLIAETGLVPIQRKDIFGIDCLTIHRFGITITEKELRSLSRLKCPCVFGFAGSEYQLKSPQAFSLLGQMPQLLSFDLWGQRSITHEHLDGLALSKSLQELNLGHQEMDFREVQAICRIKSLRRLYLNATGIGDQEIQRICEQLPTLELLHIGENRNAAKAPTDRSLPYLQSLTRLRDLYLRDDVGVTDAAVEQLGTLKQLEKLDLRGTGISAAGVARLKELLPNTQLNQD